MCASITSGSTVAGPAGKSSSVGSPCLILAMLNCCHGYGPNAPTSVKALLTMPQEHRKRGYSLIRDVYAPRMMSTMAAPVRRKNEHTSGVVVIAGPSLRLTDTRMHVRSKAFGNHGGACARGRRVTALEIREHGGLGKSSEPVVMIQTGCVRPSVSVSASASAPLRLRRHSAKPIACRRIAVK